MPAQKLSYFERWSITRQAGFIKVFLLNAFRAFLVILLAQMLYQMSVVDLTFSFNVLHVAGALAASLAYWFINEHLYGLHQRKQSKPQ